MNKNPSRRSAITQIIAGAAALALPSLGQSQSVPGWPNRPVKVVIPSAPGGQTDILGRFLCEHLWKVFGQPFVPDNKPGATGSIGAMSIVGAPADGHSMLFSAAGFTIVPSAVNPSIPYNLLRDLIPIVQVGVGGLFLAVAPGFPAKNMQELFALIRQAPGQLSYGTHGIGSTTHLITAALLAQRGLQMNHVPYKSTAEVLRDVLGGILQIGWIDSTSSLGSIRAGKVRVLANGSTYLAPLSPDVPTLTSAGAPWDLNGWFGMFARTGTPMPIVQAVNSEINKLLQSDEGKARMISMNCANPPPQTSEEFTKMIRKDLPLWKQIVVDNHIQSVG